ncbi:unnamed protein product [Urochloa humidicola]
MKLARWLLEKPLETTSSCRALGDLENETVTTNMEKHLQVVPHQGAEGEGDELEKVPVHACGGWEQELLRMHEVEHVPTQSLCDLPRLAQHKQSRLECC